MVSSFEEKDNRLRSASSMSHLAPDNSSIPRRPSSVYSQSISILSSTEGQRPLPRRSDTENFDPSLGATPLSPFYTHPMTQTSLDQLKCELLVRAQSHPHSHLLRMPSPVNRAESTESEHPDTLGWPVPETRKKTLRWSNTSAKKKFWIKLLIGVVVVGAMIGIALGISVAVDAPVWKSKNRYEEIR